MTFSTKIHKFHHEGGGITLYINLSDKTPKCEGTYKETNATKDDIENDKKVVDNYYSLLATGNGNTDFILKDLLDCRNRYTDFIKCVSKDADEIYKRIRECSLDFVQAIISMRIIEPTILTIPVEDEQIIPKYWNLFMKDKMFHCLKWDAESYNKNAKEVLGDKFWEWKHISGFIAQFYDATNLLNAATDFLENSLKPLIAKLVNETPTDVKNIDNPIENPVIMDNLQNVYDEFPKFEKDFPILFNAHFITVSSDKASPHLVWRKNQISFAKYFRFITEKRTEKPKTNWKVLKSLFNREVAGNLNSLKRVVSKSKADNQDCSDLEKLLGITLP